MFRRRTLLLAGLLAAATCCAAQAEDPIARLGRYWGFGWGDGYHAKRTWGLCEGDCRAAPEPAPAPQPAAKPDPKPNAKPAEGSKVEPASPSDRSAIKTGRRYPTASQRARR